MPQIVLVLGDISDSTVVSVLDKCVQSIKSPRVVRMTFDEVFPGGGAKAALTLRQVDLLIMEDSGWEEMKSRSRRTAYNEFYQKYQPEIWTHMASGHLAPRIF